MQVNETNLRSENFFQTKKKEELASEEFKAYLKDLSENEKDEEIKKLSDFSEEEMDLSNVLKNFQNYAYNKSIKDKQKQNENTVIQKLFNVIDTGNEFNKA